MRLHKPCQRWLKAWVTPKHLKMPLMTATTEREVRFLHIDILNVRLTFQCRWDPKHYPLEYGGFTVLYSKAVGREDRRILKYKYLRIEYLKVAIEHRNPVLK